MVIVDIKDHPQFQVGTQVVVEDRTWVGICKYGGVGRITKLFRDDEDVERVNVKYILGGNEKNIELVYVKPHEELNRTSRSRSRRSLDPASVSNSPSGNKENVQEKQLPGPEKKSNVRSKSPIKRKRRPTKTKPTSETFQTKKELPSLVIYKDKPIDETQTLPKPQAVDSDEPIQATQDKNTPLLAPTEPGTTPIFDIDLDRSLPSVIIIADNNNNNNMKVNKMEKQSQATATSSNMTKNRGKKTTKQGLCKNTTAESKKHSKKKDVVRMKAGNKLKRKESDINPADDTDPIPESPTKKQKKKPFTSKQTNLTAPCAPEEVQKSEPDSHRVEMFTECLSHVMISKATESIKIDDLLVETNKRVIKEKKFTEVEVRACVDILQNQNRVFLAESGVLYKI